MVKKLQIQYGCHNSGLTPRNFLYGIAQRLGNSEKLNCSKKEFFWRSILFLDKKIPELLPNRRKYVCRLPNTQHGAKRVRFEFPFYSWNLTLIIRIWRFFRLHNISENGCSKVSRHLVVYCRKGNKKIRQFVIMYFYRSSISM